MGDKFEEEATEPVGPGGFVTRPKGMVHFVWVSEDTLLQLHGLGPQGITYVNPADDPRKKYSANLQGAEWPFELAASQASSIVTTSLISQSRFVTPAAIAGVMRSVLWTRTKL